MLHAKNFEGGIVVLCRLVAFALMGGQFAPAAIAAPLAADDVQVIQSLLQTPVEQIDFARGKLTLDKLIDPSINIQVSMREIDRMVSTIRSMSGPTASDREKLTAVRTYIYESGPWNDHRSFQYDMTDPFGEKVANKLLPNYLFSRRGNCVTMPALFVILADRLGLPVSLSTAPLHIFVKYTDRATGKSYNIETTSGAHPARDAWYREKMPMTDQAIANGLYLKTLSKREAVAVMAEVVLEQAMQNRQAEKAIAIADLILAVYPNDAAAIIHQGSAHALLIEQRFRDKYPTPRDIPYELRQEYFALAEENQAAFARAEALGWREPPPDANR